MAITTADGLVAGLTGGQDIVISKASVTSAAGYWYTLFNVAGQPGAGSLSIGDTSAGVVPTDATSGAPTITAFAEGATGYLGVLEMLTYSSGGSVRLMDRLYHAGSFDTSSTGTTTLSSQPSFAGRVPDTNYGCVEAWLEVNTAFGSNTTDVSITYTNQSGTTGQTATLDTNLASAPTQRMLQFRLAAGDTGIQKLESVIVATATNTGTFNIVLARELGAMLCNAQTVVEPSKNAFGLGMSKMFDTSCLTLMVLAVSTTTPNIRLRTKVMSG